MLHLAYRNYQKELNSLVARTVKLPPNTEWYVESAACVIFELTWFELYMLLRELCLFVCLFVYARHYFISHAQGNSQDQCNALNESLTNLGTWALRIGMT